MAYHDLWFHPDIHPIDNSRYYSCISIYADDIFIVSHQHMKYMEMIKSHFHVKPESIKSPDLYLGMSCKQNDTGIWLLSPNAYTKGFLKVADKIITDLKLKIPNNGHHPFSNIQYKP